MKIKILGSGGGEGFPATFCSCEHCEMARKAGGKSLRTLSQTLINDDLLIDFPADTGSHCIQYGINLGKLQHVLITHAHEDHYMPTSLICRGDCFAHHMKYEKLYMYGPENLEQIFEDVVSPYGISPVIRKDIEFVVLQDGQKENIGEYVVTALRASHAPHLLSLNYIIEKDGKSILYLLDSGYPTSETFQLLEARKQTFDAVIMDGTMGVAPVNAYIHHMGFAENKMLKEELNRRNLVDKNTRFVVTHITHNQAETHDKIEEIFVGTDIEVAYDGFEFEI